MFSFRHFCTALFEVRDTIYRITDELGDGVRLSTYDILKFILYF